MNFKKDMKRVDYIYLDIITKMEELSEMGIADFYYRPELTSTTAQKVSKEDIAKKEDEIKILINRAALALGYNTKGEIKKISDVNKFPEMYNWLYLTEPANNETLAAFNIKKTLETYGIKEEPTLAESIALVHFGMEEPWKLIQKYSSGQIKDEESLMKVYRMKETSPQIKSLIQRLTRQRDCVDSVNYCLEMYLGSKRKINKLEEIPVEVLNWKEYRTTLPKEYFNNSLPEDKEEALKSLNALSTLNKKSK